MNYPNEYFYVPHKATAALRIHGHIERITTPKVVTSIKTTINFDKNSTLSRTLIIHILRDPSPKLPDGNYTRAHPRQARPIH